MTALKGFRVVDFTQVIFGPAATQVLAEHGAEVIKIERLRGGDLARDFGPWHNGQSLPFAGLNLSKRSLSINLKTEQGLEIIHRLLKNADVLVHNFRSRKVMEKLGLDYETLKERYPRLVYAAGSGYGSTGPYVERNKGGHESMAQALSGAAARFVGATGPQRLPFTVSDFTGGMLLAQAILIALLARERSNEGQYVETSLLDGMMSMQAWTTSSLLNGGDPKEDDGSGGASHPRGNPLDGAVFKTADGYLMVTALFRSFGDLMIDLEKATGVDGLSTDDRFQDLESAKDHRSTLNAILEPVFAKRCNADWIPLLEEYDILVAPIKTTQEALQDPQLEINNMLHAVEHAELGIMRHVGTPLRLSSTPAEKPEAAPLLGEQNRQILYELGYTETQVKEIMDAGIIGGPEKRNS
mgnify:CR=1 FL=1